MKALISIFFATLFLAPVMNSSPDFKGTNSEVLIPENQTKKFTEDPVAYITKNFNLKNHPEFLASEDGSNFLVTFKCAKGRLEAKYNSKGELTSTRHKFKNVSIPSEIMADIYRDFKGWEVADINYKASGRGETVKTARYKILLKKDGQEKVFIKKVKS